MTPRALSPLVTRPSGTEHYQDTPRYKGGFGVASSSGRGGGKLYKLCYDTAVGYWVCSCPAGIFRGECKHLAMYNRLGRAKAEREPQRGYVAPPTFAPAAPSAKPLPEMPKAIANAPRRRFMFTEDV